MNITDTEKTMDKETKQLVFIVSLLIVAMLAIGIVITNVEKNTFNKYRDPNTSPATFWEAACTNLRVTTK